MFIGGSDLQASWKMSRIAREGGGGHTDRLKVALLAVNDPYVTFIFSF